MINFSECLEQLKPPAADMLAYEQHRISRGIDDLKNKRAFWLRIFIVFGLVLFIVAIASAFFYGDDEYIATSITFLACVGLSIFAFAFFKYKFASDSLDFPPFVFAWSELFLVTTLMGLMPAIAAAVIIFLIAWYIERLDFELDTKNDLLAMYEAINPSDTPDECISLDRWRDLDDTIRDYLTALTRLGRIPVLGEYQAAFDWMAKLERRKHDADFQARAQQACERFTSQQI